MSSVHRFYIIDVGLVLLLIIGQKCGHLLLTTTPLQIITHPKWLLYYAFKDIVTDPLIKICDYDGDNEWLRIETQRQIEGA